MNLKIELLLLVVACAGYAVTQEDIDLSKPPTSTSTASTTTVESTSSSTASTTASTTTSTTASTTASTTTSTAASTSTKTSPPTSAETTASTQHTEGPTTTPKSQDFWAVKNNNGSYCILLKASFLIEFKYKNTNNETVTSTVNLIHSNHTSVEGSCDLEKQSIEIRFFSNWTLTLSFEKSNDKYYYQSEVRLVWDLKEAQITGAPEIWGDNSNNAPMFNTSKTGYLCLARMTLYNNASVESGLLSIYTEQLKLEAFQAKKEPLAFSDQYERCKEDTISNLVPIIVGACLGGLIIIVLVAYLIGRKRSRRGYESV